jgi:hypothetical protein
VTTAIFVNHPGLEVCAGFSAGRGQSGEFFDPSFRISWIELLYFDPAKSFPVAKVNLAQARSFCDRCGKCLRDRLGCTDGAAQIATVDLVYRFVRQVRNEVEDLMLATGVDGWIGVTAERAGHVRLGVSY